MNSSCHTTTAPSLVRPPRDQPSVGRGIWGPHLQSISREVTPLIRPMAKEGKVLDCQRGRERQRSLARSIAHLLAPVLHVRIARCWLPSVQCPVHRAPWRVPKAQSSQPPRHPLPADKPQPSHHFYIQTFHSKYSPSVEDDALHSPLNHRHEDAVGFTNVVASPTTSTSKDHHATDTSFPYNNVYESDLDRDRDRSPTHFSIVSPRPPR